MRENSLNKRHNAKANQRGGEQRDKKQQCLAQVSSSALSLSSAIIARLLLSTFLFVFTKSVASCRSARFASSQKALVLKSLARLRKHSLACCLCWKAVSHHQAVALLLCFVLLLAFLW